VKLILAMEKLGVLDQGESLAEVLSKLKESKDEREAIDLQDFLEKLDTPKELAPMLHRDSQRVSDILYSNTIAVISKITRPIKTKCRLSQFTCSLNSYFVLKQ